MGLLFSEARLLVPQLKTMDILKFKKRVSKVIFMIDKFEEKFKLIEKNK